MIYCCLIDVCVCVCVRGDGIFWTKGIYKTVKILEKDFYFKISISN